MKKHNSERKKVLNDILINPEFTTKEMKQKIESQLVVLQKSKEKIKRKRKYYLNIGSEKESKNKEMRQYKALSGYLQSYVESQEIELEIATELMIALRKIKYFEYDVIIQKALRSINTFDMLDIIYRPDLAPKNKRGISHREEWNQKRRKQIEFLVKGEKLIEELESKIESLRSKNYRLEEKNKSLGVTIEKVEDVLEVVKNVFMLREDVSFQEIEETVMKLVQQSDEKIMEWSFREQEKERLLYKDKLMKRIKNKN